MRQIKFILTVAALIALVICAVGCAGSATTTSNGTSAGSNAYASELTAILQSRVDSQTETFKDYTPDEMYKIDGKNIVTKGDYVALIICADNAKAIETFNTMAGEGAAPANIKAKIFEAVEFPSPADTDSRMTDFYSADEAKVEAFAGAICGSGAYPDEIAIFKLAK